MDGYQERVGRHVAIVTVGDPTDLAERRDRFGEESLEFQQALGQTAAEAHALVDYVHGRQVGEPGAELGGTLYTLAGLANEVGLRMSEAAERELARVSTPEVTAKIRRKRAARHGRGPLPGVDGSPSVVGDARCWFANGVSARAAGTPRSAVPSQDMRSMAAWEAGWDACDAWSAA